MPPVKLNLPVWDQLLGCRNLLIAGMGGGFDIFCGLPIYFELRERGQRAHLANLSFSPPQLARLGTSRCLTETLIGVTAGHHRLVGSFPEFYLARWLQERLDEQIPIWCFTGGAVPSLVADYRALIAHLSIDGILLVDGGVDSLVRGDEPQLGTILEDAITLCAVNELSEVPVRLMTCLGMGAEQDINYGHILENISELTASRAFHGSCSLTGQMPSYQAYEEAVLYAHGQRLVSPSVINASVISAVQGHSGNFHLLEKTRGSHLRISPLMSIYWFFDLQGVAERNLFLPHLRHTRTRSEAMRVIMDSKQQGPKRPRRSDILPPA